MLFDALLKKIERAPKQFSGLMELTNIQRAIAFSLLAILFTIPGYLFITKLKSFGRRPFLLNVFLGSVVSLTVLAMTGALGTLIRLSAPVFCGWYLGCLILITCWAMRNPSRLFKRIRSQPFSWFTAAFVLLLVLDFAISWVAGTMGTSDASVHQARLTFMTAYGLSVFDPFFHEGVESRYLLNLPHWVGLILKLVTSSKSHEAWGALSPLFRSELFLAFYFGVYWVTRKERWASVAALILICLLGNSMKEFNLPKKVALIWIIAWVSVYLKSSFLRFAISERLATLFALLIAMTHPASALWTALISLSSYLSRLFFSGRVGLRPFFIQNISTIILCVPGVVSGLLASQMVPEVFYWWIPKLNPWGFHLFSLEDTKTNWILLWGAAFGFWQLRRFVSQRAFLAVAIPGLFAHLVITHSPFVFPVLMRWIPYWVIDRARGINETLQLFFIAGGLVVLSQPIAKILKVKAVRILAIMSAGFIFFYPTFLRRIYYRHATHHNLNYLNEFGTLFSDFNSAPAQAPLILASPSNSITIPTFIPARVVYIPPTNCNPSIDIVAKGKMFDELWANGEINPGAVRKYGVKYVLLDKTQDHRVKPFLRLHRESRLGSLYEVIP